MAIVRFVVLAAVLIQLTSAGGIYSNSTNTSVTPTPPTLFSSNWDALMAALGLSQSRQAEAAVLSQMMSSFLGLIATGKIIPFLAPVIVSYVVLPLMALLKTAAKGLLMLGVAAWLISVMVPFGLAYFGMTGAGAFVSRAFQNAASPLVAYVDMVAPQSLVTKCLQMADMDNVECRMQIACKAGAWTTENWPQLVQFINTSGVLALAEQQAKYDPYTSLAIKALRGQISCERELSPCPGLTTVENMLDPQRVANISQQWVATYVEPTTTTTPPPSFLANDIVVNTLKRLAQNYYSYST